MISIKHSPRIGLGLLGAAIAMGAFACSVTAGSGTPTGDGGKPDGQVDPDGAPLPGDDGGPGNDGGPGDDGGSGSTKTGTIYLSQSKPTASTFSTYVAANFSNSPATPSTNCTTTMAGSCTVTECPPAAPVDAGAPVEPPSAGEITITGGMIAAPGIVLTPGTDKTYTGKSGSAQIYAGGDTLSVKAAGGDVPAFDGKTLMAPADLTGFAPSLAIQTPIVIPTDADFTFNWAGGGTGKALLSLSTADSTAHSVVLISCSVAANANKGTVPKEALAKLLKTSATINGIVSVTPINTSPFTSGDYAIVLSASGTGASGSFTTQ